MAVEGDPIPLEVVEFGYSPIAGDAASVTYAALLRNPNAAWAATRVEIHVDFLDADGGFIAGEEVVATVLPGQTTAIGGRAQGAGPAASMQVVPPEDLVGFRPRAAADEAFTTEEVSTTSAGGQATTTGAVRSAFETEQSFVQLVAVYRDVTGAIVGGGTGGVESIPPGGTAGFEIVEASPSGPIAATEVYWQVAR